MACAVLSADRATAQPYRLTKSTSADDVPAGGRPPSNSASHIVVDHGTLWLGTSKGVGKSIDGGRRWTNYAEDPAFAYPGIFAISSEQNLVWASMGYSKEIDDGSVQTGGGYAFSTDGGAHWRPLPQTLDGRGDSIIAYGINDSLWSLPVIVPEQNVTFDIALSAGTVWIASWASGLRKSTDNGDHWERVILPPDTRRTISPEDTLWTYASGDTLRTKRLFNRFDPRRNNNLLAFSVFVDDSGTIWCGTAGGINKSTDGGRSWLRFTHQNQQSPILGNWVIAIDGQRFGSIRRLWITNWKAEDPEEEFGVSYTDDGGRTWTTFLHGVRAYDFAFRDSITYIATEQGIYRTPDGGRTVKVVSSILDEENRQIITTAETFAVAVDGDTVYAATGDGTARTTDGPSESFGSQWTIVRTYEPVGPGGGSYAYPNPFSPALGVVRIHYTAATHGTSGTSGRSVRLEIFDFGMIRVRTLLNEAQRDASAEHDEIWDGRDDSGRTVANGVYFFRLVIDDNEPQYGKILVVQ